MGLRQKLRALLDIIVPAEVDSEEGLNAPLLAPDGTDAQEYFFFKGLSGEELDEPLLHLQTLLTHVHATRSASLEGDLSFLESELAACSKSIDSLTDRSKELDIKAEEALTNLTEAEEKLEHHHVSLELLNRQISAQRLSYPGRILRKSTEEKLELIVHLTNRWETASGKLHEIEKASFTRHSERWKLNEPEYTRRVQEESARREPAKSDLDALRNLIARLRLNGVSWTTANFLVWSSYLAFPILGWLFGQFLEGTISDSEGFFGSILVLLTGLAKDLANDFTLLGASIIMLGGALALVSLPGVVVWGGDKVLAGLDQRWTEQNSGRTRVAPVQTSFPSLAPSNRAISRNDYVQILAKLPFVFTWSMLPITLSLIFAGSPSQSLAVRSNSGLQIGDPYLELFFSLLGMILSIAIAGAILLYVVNVIRPRLESEHSSSRPAALKHIEFTLCLAALVGVFLMPIGDQSVTRHLWPPSSPLGTALLAVVVGFAVSYGLIFRGYFRDLRTLDREVSQRDEIIRQFSSLPAIVSDDHERELYLRMVRDLDDHLDKLWAEAERASPWFDGSSLVMSAEQPGASSTLENLLRHIVPIDYVLAPEATAELLEKAQMVVYATRQIDDVAKHQAAVLSDHETVSRELRAARDRERELLELKAQKEGELNAIHHSNQVRLTAAIEQAKTAYELGRLASINSPRDLLGVLHGG